MNWPPPPPPHQQPLNSKNYQAQAPPPPASFSNHQQARRADNGGSSSATPHSPATLTPPPAVPHHRAPSPHEKASSSSVLHPPPPVPLPKSNHQQPSHSHPPPFSHGPPPPHHGMPPSMNGGHAPAPLHHGTPPPPGPPAHGMPPSPPANHRRATQPHPPGMPPPKANGMPPPPHHSMPPPPPHRPGMPPPSPSINGMPPTPAPRHGMPPPAPQHGMPPPPVPHNGGMPPPPPHQGMPPHPPPPPHHGMPSPHHHGMPPSPPPHHGVPPHPGMPPPHPGMPPHTSPHNRMPPPPPPPGPPGMPPPPAPGHPHPTPPGSRPAPRPPQQPRALGTKPKINPAQIPRPPLFTRPQNGMPVPIYYPKGALREEKILPPPPADSRFLVHDDGNASPQLIRSTLYAIPDSSGVSRHGGIDMGLICTPMAIVSEDFVRRPKTMPDGSVQTNTDPQRIPLVRGTISPPRCPRCFAYANPFWCGRSCNFCRSSHGHSDPSGPSFHYGTVEYEVDGPYITRSQPVAPVSIYAIDATCNDVPKLIDIVKHVGNAMAQHWQAKQQVVSSQVKPRIGCCVMSCTGLVLVTHRNGEPVFTIMPDVAQDPFCPLPLEEWTFDMSTEQGLEDWNAITSTLWETLQPILKEALDGPDVFGMPGRSLSPGGAALSALADALRESGGRATWITHQRPNFGVGSIPDREGRNLQNYTHSASENLLFTPLQRQCSQGLTKNEADLKTGEFYKKLAEECAKNRACIDIVLITPPSPPAFLDVATLSELCRVTCGKFKWIRGIHAWPEQLKEELCRAVLSFGGSDTVFKVRCSDGLQVKSYLSSTAPGVTIDNGIARSPELEMSVVTPDTCIAVELEHRVGGIPNSCKIVYFQSALLYTTSTGRRRVRVSTLALRKTSDVAVVFRSADFSAITAMLTRQAIRQVWDAKEDHGRCLLAAREDLKKRCVTMLANYRLYTSAKSSPLGQLILPETIQLLPLFCMSLTKSDMLRPSLPKRESGLHVDHPSPNADDRAYGLYHGSAVMPALAMLMVHPNAFLITTLVEGDGEWQIPSSSDRQSSSEFERAALAPYVQLPRSTHLSITLLEDDGIYIIDNGLALYIHIGKDVPQDVRAELFEQHGTDPCSLSVSGASDYGQQILRLIWQLRSFCSVGGGSESVIRPTFAPIAVVLADRGEKDPFEERVLTLMVDDTTQNEDDYVDFLCALHRQIKEAVGKG